MTKLIAITIVFIHVSLNRRRRLHTRNSDYRHIYWTAGGVELYVCGPS